MRDFATIEQLLVLTNLENMNAFYIKQQIPQNERLQLLRKMAIEQLETLSNTKSTETLNALHNNPRLF